MSSCFPSAGVAGEPWNSRLFWGRGAVPDCR